MKLKENIIVLMVVHNRVDFTIKCLESLSNQVIDKDVDLSVIVVDDGSNDGTHHALKNLFPNVEVIVGNGSLFWNQGMRLAFDAAIIKSPDYIMWLNNDTFLYPNAIRNLLELINSEKCRDSSKKIGVGSVKDSKSNMLSYGGWQKSFTWKFHLKKVNPQSTPIRCDTFNGNCVLIPRSAYLITENLDPKFTHSMGDLDYGFRAGKAGCEIWIAPGFLGECDHNELNSSYRSLKGSIIERARILLSPKGLPLAEWRVFTQRYFGRLWFIYWLMPYLKFLLDSLVSTLTFRHFK